MARGLSGSMQTEAAAVSIRPVFFFECGFDSTTIRLTTHDYNLTWNSQTWLGNNWITAIGNVAESPDLRANNFEVTLTGVPSEIVSLVLADANQSKAGILWLGALDGAGAVIADPIKIFAGKLDVPEIYDSGEESTIVLSFESHLVNLDRPHVRRYTHGIQQQLFPGDRGFLYVRQVANWSGYWGKPEKPKGKTRKPKTTR